ncbi:unnamed protein product [Leptidea sinapis]|uniref:Uncharacterized protein n=1 Tax=Leptidea sinapis TaxID=189913 RepID=A0A5E4QLS1_9NEOP|nr:unnamed protein product [Leptidea sinapis]
MRLLTLRLIGVILALIVLTDCKKMSRSRSSGRSSSRKTNYNPQPAPTSFSNPQASAPKPSLFGWQEKTPQKSQSSRQSNTNNQRHSYPSSNTGLSGNTQPKKHQIQQEHIQKSNVPHQQSASQPGTPNQMGHSYPASNGLSGKSGTANGYSQGTGLSGNAGTGNGYPQGTGLSGNTGTGNGYPQGSGLSGPNLAPPPYQAANPFNTYRTQNNYQHSAGAPPPYSNVGNPHYNHGPPPPYSNYGGNYGGYGAQGGYAPQMPGYFGGYSNYGKGFGGVGRSGSSLAGVGIAGAGIGTILTGLALWNLARSTGHHHHTVIYDNRGQPVAVAPANGTAPPVDSILGDLENCTLSINTENSTDVIAIPCSIATSFTPDADVKDANVDNPDDNTKCIITVMTKSGKEFMTTIPCAVLLKSAAENNVTENIATAENSTTEISNMTIAFTTDLPEALKLVNDSSVAAEHKLNCTSEAGDVKDPINPCFSIQHDLTVVPLSRDVISNSTK